MRFGYVPAIIVSSPEAAEKFFKTNDQPFANSPIVKVLGTLIMSKGDGLLANMVCIGETLVSLAFYTHSVEKRFDPILSRTREEVGVLVKSLKQASFDGAAVHLSAATSSLGAMAVPKDEIRQGTYNSSI